MALYPDLTAARRSVERVLFGGPGDTVPGTVAITFDPDAALDDTFDTNTGEWTRVGQTTVYTGRAHFAAASYERTVKLGGQDMSEAMWDLRLPLSAPVPQVGAFVEILTCVRDPAQVGRRFRIGRVMGSAFALTRAALMYEFVDGPTELP